MILSCFTVQKLYGRDAGSLEAVTSVFHRLLATYPANKVIRAFELWMTRSQEFPTPADIISIINNNGRKPLSREVYISISKKEPEYRTPEDWAYIRNYEQDQQREEFGSEFKDDDRIEAVQTENARLRSEMKEMKAEYHRLSGLLAEERRKTVAAPPPLSMQEKIERTVAAMREAGASDDEIAESRASAD